MSGSRTKRGDQGSWQTTDGRDDAKLRRGHSGFYEAATEHERTVLQEAFPLAEALQLAADSFLKDRRRYPDPECVRTVLSIRDECTLAESKQVSANAVACARARGT